MAPTRQPKKSPKRLPKKSPRARKKARGPAPRRQSSRLPWLAAAIAAAGIAAALARGCAPWGRVKGAAFVLEPWGEVRMADGGPSPVGAVGVTPGGGLPGRSRQGLDSWAAASPDGRYLFRVERYDDVPTQATRHGQDVFHVTRVESWVAGYPKPVWVKQLQLELLSLPVVTKDGQAWFACVEPNREPEGRLKLLRLGRDGSITKAYELEALAAAGLDTPQFESSRAPKDGDCLALNFLRSREIFKPRAIEACTFFFDLEKGRLWSDRKDWIKAGLEPDSAAWLRARQSLEDSGLKL